MLAVHEGGQSKMASGLADDFVAEGVEGSDVDGMTEFDQSVGHFLLGFTVEGEGEDAKLTISFPGHGLKKIVEKYAGIKIDE